MAAVPAMNMSSAMANPLSVHRQRQGWDDAEAISRRSQRRKQ